MSAKKKVMLVILDGFGEGKPTETNAIHVAKTPFIDQLRANYPTVLLEPGGGHVGVLDSAFGSSGVGHNTIGTGTCVRQAIKVIDDAINDETFFDNKALLGAIKHAKKNNSNLHLYGFGSDSMLHSYTKFIYALLDLCIKENFPGERVFLHLATDGRDTDPDGAPEWFGAIESECEKRKMGKIASIIGRIFFDRGLDWPRIEKLYDLFTSQDQAYVTSWRDYVKKGYENGVYDQEHEPMALGDDDGMYPRMNHHDAIINFNFRADRERQITSAFVSDPFWGFFRSKTLHNIYHVGFISYGKGLEGSHDAFEEDACTLCLSEVLEQHKLRHYHIAGKEKYIFITYNFNRCQELNLPLQTNVKAPQTKEVHTFDQNPEMSEPHVTELVLESLEKGDQEVYFINYENPDQVGHTGNLPAAVEAVEAVEKGLSQLIPKALEKGFEILVTADHGNCDEMVDENGKPHTAHTYNPVPFLFISNDRSPQLRQDGDLADIAPTILDMMELEKPESMTGSSLIIK